MRRILEPEIIDSIPWDHPTAIRSRRDLRLINFLMGNARWILRGVRRFRELAREGIVELGSGDGRLLRRLARFGPATGFDLIPRPPDLPESVRWRQGDLRQHQGDIHGGILVANLFLHHLDAAGLAELGETAKRFDAVVVVDPHRTEDTLWMATRLLPLVGEATRHDMMASIRAGFQAGELPESLDLGEGWRVEETVTWRGTLRLLAWRES